MKYFIAVSKKIYLVSEILALFLLSIIMSLLFIQVILRYGFNFGFPWVEELCRYMFIWMIFIGAGIGVKKGIHASMEVFTKFLSSGRYGFYQDLLNIVTLIFSTILLVIGIKFANGIGGQTASSIPISMFWVYVSAPVGGILMMLCAVENILVRRIPGYDDNTAA